MKRVSMAICVGFISTLMVFLVFVGPFFIARPIAAFAAEQWAWDEPTVGAATHVFIILVLVFSIATYLGVGDEK